MRSIIYVLGGKPCCFADCIDYMKNNKLINVSLDLKSSNEITENIIMRKLLGYFTWNYKDLIVTYEEQFGGIVESESEQRHAVSILNANRRLDRRVRDFNMFDINLINKDKRFTGEF